MSNPYQTCPQCGASLVPGQMICGNCGRRLDNNPPQYAGQAAYNPYGGDGGYTSYGPPPPSSGGYQAYPPAPAYPSPGGYQQQQPAYPPPGGYPQPVPPKKSNAGLIVGIVLLLVVVIGGGAFWYVTRNGTSGGPTLNTSPALFSDNFDNNSNKWTTTSSGGYTRSIDGGYLKLKENNQGKVLYNDFPNQPPADATITVNFKLVKAGQDDIVGLILRNNSQNNSIYGYYVDVYGDGTYDIQRYYFDTAANKGKIDYLLKTQSTGLKGIGQENEMTVTIKGSSISLTLNGQSIKTVTDSTSTFASGTTSLFVESSDNSDGVEAWFNSVAVYSAK